MMYNTEKKQDEKKNLKPELRLFLNPLHHVKILLSPDPNIFLNDDDRSVIEGFAQNNAVKLVLIYSGQLLNESGQSDLQLFKEKYSQISTIDFDIQIQQSLTTQDDPSLYGYAKDEIDKWQEKKGGSLKAAANLIRWISSVTKLGIYSLFDQEISESFCFDRPIPINSNGPFFFNLSETTRINSPKGSDFPDVLVFATNLEGNIVSEGEVILKKIQFILVANYKNPFFHLIQNSSTKKNFELSALLQKMHMQYTSLHMSVPQIRYMFENCTKSVYMFFKFSVEKQVVKDILSLTDSQADSEFIEKIKDIDDTDYSENLSDNQKKSIQKNVTETGRATQEFLLKNDRKERRLTRDSFNSIDSAIRCDLMQQVIDRYDNTEHKRSELYERIQTFLQYVDADNNQYILTQDSNNIIQNIFGADWKTASQNIWDQLLPRSLEATWIYIEELLKEIASKLSTEKNKIRLIYETRINCLVENLKQADIHIKNKNWDAAFEILIQKNPIMKSYINRLLNESVSLFLEIDTETIHSFLDNSSNPVKEELPLFDSHLFKNVAHLSAVAKSNIYRQESTQFPLIEKLRNATIRLAPEKSIGPQLAVNTLNHVKVYLSRDPNEFISSSVRARLEEFVQNNPKATLTLIYSSSLLKENGLEDCKNFKNIFKTINLLDFDRELKDSLKEQKDLEIHDITLKEIEAWKEQKGGSLKAATNILRWMTPVVERGIFSHIERVIKTNFEGFSPLVEIDSPILFNIKEKNPVIDLFQKNIGTRFGEDVVAFANNQTGGLDYRVYPLLKKLQTLLTEKYNNPLENLKNILSEDTMKNAIHMRNINMIWESNTPLYSVINFRFLIENAKKSICSFIRLWILLESSDQRSIHDVLWKGVSRTDFSDHWGEVNAIKKDIFEKSIVYSEWMLKNLNLSKKHYEEKSKEEMNSIWFLLMEGFVHVYIEQEYQQNHNKDSKKDDRGSIQIMKDNLQSLALRDFTCSRDNGVDQSRSHTIISEYLKLAQNENQRKKMYSELEPLLTAIFLNPTKNECQERVQRLCTQDRFLAGIDSAKSFISEILNHMQDHINKELLKHNQTITILREQIENAKSCFLPGCYKGEWDTGFKFIMESIDLENGSNFLSQNYQETVNVFSAPGLVAHFLKEMYLKDTPSSYQEADFFKYLEKYALKNCWVLSEMLISEPKILGKSFKVEENQDGLKKNTEIIFRSQNAVQKNAAQKIQKMWISHKDKKNTLGYVMV